MQWGNEMEKNQIVNRKKFLLLAFICICWFLPRNYTDVQSYSQKETLIKVVVIILAFVGTTVFYYFCKNSILRLLVMISAIVCITVFIGYKYMLTVYAAFAVIYVYKSFVTEGFKNEKINVILLALAPLIAIAGFIINFEAIKNIDAEAVVIIFIFVVAFLILRNCAHGKRLNTKAKKSNKIREQEKNTEMFHKALFAISIIGLLSSAVSDTINNAITFFPWFFFIALLIYEEDKSLNDASEMIVNKIKAFLE